MTQDRVERIRRLIEDKLTPEQLEVINESHLHIGHDGAKDGRGHFRVKIQADALSGLSLIKQHRAIYEAVGDMMETDIHALSIEILHAKIADTLAQSSHNREKTSQ